MGVVASQLVAAWAHVAEWCAAAVAWVAAGLASFGELLEGWAALLAQLLCQEPSALAAS